MSDVTKSITQEALSVSASSRDLDLFETTFDHQGLVANAGLIVAATLMARLGLEALINRWVRTGSANAGRKVFAVVAAMMAGATHIDQVDMLRAGATQRVLPFTVAVPSTVGTFLRSFTFGPIGAHDGHPAEDSIPGCSYQRSEIQR